MSEMGKRKTESMMLISTAFLKMLNTKKVSDITVSDLCKEATVSRNTFYRLFRSVDDVVAFMINKKLKEIMERYEAIPMTELLEPTRKTTWIFYRNFFSIWANEKEFLKSIIDNKLDEQIYRCMPGAFLNKISEMKIRHVALPHFEEYYYAALAGLMASMLLAWVRNDFQNSPEEMGEVMVHIVESYQFRPDRDDQ